MTSTYGPAKSPRIAMLGRLLRRLGRKMQISVETHFGAADISYRQWTAMLSIHEIGVLETATLALELEMTSASAARIVLGLEARGLVSSDCSDRGSARLQLTPAGLIKLQEATPSIERRLADALAGLPESEIDTLMQLLARLADSIDRHAMRVMQQSLRA